MSLGCMNAWMDADLAHQNLKWPSRGFERTRDHTREAMLRSAPGGKAMSSLTTSHHGALAFAEMMRFPARGFKNHCQRAADLIATGHGILPHSHPPAQPVLIGSRTTRMSGRSACSNFTAADTSSSSPLWMTTSV